MTTFGDDSAVGDLAAACAMFGIPFGLIEYTDDAGKRVDVRLGPVSFPLPPAPVAMFGGAFHAALADGRECRLTRDGDALTITTTIRPSH